MKTKVLVATTTVVFLAACAPQNADKESGQRIIRENEQRIASLEHSVTALNSQIAQINNRVYEVRNRNGQKTSMTVVPIVKSDSVEVPVAPPADKVVHTPAPAKVKTTRVRKPAPKPVTQPTKAPVTQAAASGSVGTPASNAGPNGQLGGNSELALPPADLPPQGPPPVPQGNVTLEQPNNSLPGVTPQSETPPMPVPLMPVSDLSLPPEHPVAAQASPAPNVATPASRATAPAKRRVAKQGEQAAYNAALSAARSGRTNEGIQKFRDFLQKYPNGPYSANAEYWIGECLYSQGKYKEALSEFQGVNNSFPAHHKNADALLKAGITMSKMGDKEGAAEKFRTLIARFPNSEAARRARAMGIH